MTEPKEVRKRLQAATESLVVDGDPKPLEELFEAEADEQGRLFVGDYEDAARELDGFYAKNDSPTMYF